MKILDVCCGSEKIYKGWQKQLNGEFITIDKRKGDFSYQTSAQRSPTIVKVKPTVVADMRFLPFKDRVFSGIICDPPHMDCSLSAFMSKAYGSWNQSEAIRTMRSANSEFSRVLKDSGFVFLKTMLDRKNIYRELLKDFKFFLPIQLKRQMGHNKNPRYADGAVWMIGCRSMDSELLLVEKAKVLNTNKT